MIYNFFCKNLGSGSFEYEPQIIQKYFIKSPKTRGEDPHVNFADPDPGFFDDAEPDPDPIRIRLKLTNLIL